MSDAHTLSRLHVQAPATLEGLEDVMAKLSAFFSREDLAFAEFELALLAREALNKALLSGGTVMTPLGEISLDAEGEVIQKQFYVSQIKMNPDGKTGAFVLVK